MRTDFIFTYWVLAWYVAYMMNLTVYNPKWGLVIGIILNLGLAWAVILRKGLTKTVIQFVLVNLLLKGIPIYTIYKTKTTIKDLYAIPVFFMLYALWLHVNGTSVVDENTKIFESILQEKKETPIMTALAKYL